MATSKLRFKEFDGDWTRYKIAEVTEYLVDGTHFSPKTTEGEFKYITSKNIRNDGLDLTNISYISKDEHEKIYKRCKVQLGDILLTKDGANTGNCCLNTLDEKFSLLSSVAVLRGKKDSFNNNFILQILQSDLGKDTIISSMSGQAITRITLAKLKDYSFFFPELTEQTKIASFLSNVDEKISQLTQKHALLSQYKQGMMQKLFSQQIRFKADDGSEFGEWENSYIGNECKITTGNKDTQNKVDDGLYPFFVRSQTVEKINSYSMDCEAILTSGDGVGIGKNYHYINGKFDFHQRVYCLYEFSERLIGRYLYIYFSNYFYDRVKRLSAKNSVDSVRMDMISKMEIKLPCLEEQTKIANFLSAIDQKIEVVAQQIEQAKQWKKGLLQQMFV